MQHIKRSIVITVLLSIAMAAAPAWSRAVTAQTTVRLGVNDPLVPALATSLGYFANEGLAIEVVKIEEISGEDYLMQQPLVDGKLDAAYHWFQHVVFGARHDLPLKAVVMVNDAPGMKVLVANRVKDQVHSAADFRGRNVAEGAGYATKSMLVNLLARRAGLPYGSYTPVMKETEGRQQAVLQGLNAGRVDVMAFMEPITSALEASGEVSTLYDLSTGKGTVQALGAPWLAHCVFLSDRYIAAHPDTVQHLVNAFVHTLRFINSHSAEQIADHLPATYVGNLDRQALIAKIRAGIEPVAHDDYSFAPAAVQLVLDTALASKFDESAEGQWRLGGKRTGLRAADLYTNQFVEAAMKKFPK